MHYKGTITRELQYCTSSMNSLLTHVGSLCKIASRASPVDELDVSPEELSSSSEIENSSCFKNSIIIKKIDLTSLWIQMYQLTHQFASRQTELTDIDKGTHQVFKFFKFFFFLPRSTKKYTFERQSYVMTTRKENLKL